MKTVLIAGKPVWIEEAALDALEDAYRMKFEVVDGKDKPDFQDVWIYARTTTEPIHYVKVRTATKHLRTVAQWLSRVGGVASIETAEKILLNYEGGRIGPPFNTPYPQDIDTYTRDFPDWF